MSPTCKDLAVAEPAAPYPVFVRRRPPTPSAVFDSYWRFAAERQAVFFRRLEGQSAPWTKDPIIAAHKFTNVYRATDRTSQYLIREVLYSDKTYGLRDTFLRVMLFKFFNKIDTWEHLQDRLGSITERPMVLSAASQALDAALERGQRIYSAAYIMPSGPAQIRQPRKHRMHLALLKSMLDDRLPERICEAPTMQAAYELLVGYPSIGPFLAYQFVTDLNYSAHLKFSEMEFVMPGPGARDGLRKCFTDFGDYSEADVIKWVAERQGAEFAARGLAFQTLWGRPLQLIDCQNIFCEIDKYSRVAHPEVLGRSGRTRIKQRFKPTEPPLPIRLPPKWKTALDAEPSGRTRSAQGRLALREELFEFSS
jgi:hypothetical protein